MDSWADHLDSKEWLVHRRSYYSFTNCQAPALRRAVLYRCYKGSDARIASTRIAAVLEETPDPYTLH